MDGMNENKLEIEKFFDETTMSVHLRENAVGVAKKGTPGDWQMIKVSKDELIKEEIIEMGNQIVERTQQEDGCFIEIEMAGSVVVQYKNYRIVITKPPFSDGHEITAVKPVAKLSLEDYDFDKKVMERLIQANGVLIAGSPGEEITLARALAEYFAEKGKIVKTVESPRDMLLSSKITQYSLNHAEKDEIHDVLLLSRPDRTIFDEMRNTDDFLLYADLRMAGIGMVGIVHATKAIDAIQRCIGRIELGMIPQVIDTVVFVEAGKIESVLELRILVKVPSGMTEADLARPVVEVRDYLSGKLKYEMYSYGDHTAIIPVQKKERKTVWDLAIRELKDYFSKYSRDCDVKFLNDKHIQVFLPENKISRVIGQKGQEIDKIEKELGLKIDVKELSFESEGLRFEFDKKDKYLTLFLEKNLRDQEIGIYDNEDLLVQVRASKKAIIKLQRKGALGKSVEQAWIAGRLELHKIL